MKRKKGQLHSMADSDIYCTVRIAIVDCDVFTPGPGDVNLDRILRSHKKEDPFLFDKKETEAQRQEAVGHTKQ